MAMTRRTTPLPLPGSELQRMKEYLSPRYGSEVWDGDGQRILVIRIPAPEPDLVNDLEASVEHLAPGDLAGLTGCLLVGSQRSLVVAPHPLNDLMRQRLDFDRRQGGHLRSELPPSGGHLLYRAPDDPRRHWRLAVRIPRRNVRELDDADLERIAQDVGPHLGKPAYQGAVAVYLVAGEDDVRLEPDLFFQDLRGRYDAEAIARREAEALQAAEEANRRRREAEREAILGDLRNRFPRVAVAPMRTPVAPVAWEADGHPARDLAPLHAAVDSLPGRFAAPPPSAPPPVAPPSLPEPAAEPDILAYPGRPEPAAAPVDAVPPLALTPLPGEIETTAPVAAQALASESPAAQDLESRLRSAGYDVLWDPGVAGHDVDLAAERGAGYPQRVIARFVPRMTVAVAQETLQAARHVSADLALVVAPEAEDEARKLLIATKAKWLAPDALAHLMV